MLIGYGRVSRNKQDTALQEDAFARAGVHQFVTEKWSSVGKRPRLMQLLQELKPGDVLVVWKLDRVGRGLLDLLKILDVIHQRQAGFKSLTEPIDTSSAAGRMLYSILGAFAEYERTMIRERSIAGQVAAYSRGVRWGGRRGLLDEREKAEVRQLCLDYGFTHETVAHAYDVSRSTVSRAIKPSPSRPYERLPVLSQYLSTACDE